MLKNKIQPNNFEDLVDFIQWFRNQGESHLAIRAPNPNYKGTQRGCTNWKVFYRKKGGARDLLLKKRKWWGGKKCQGFYYADRFFFSWGIEKVPVTGYYVTAPHWC